MMRVSPSFIRISASCSLSGASSPGLITISLAKDMDVLNKNTINKNDFIVAKCDLLLKKILAPFF